MITINKSKDGQYFYTYKYKKGQKGCHSEGYTRKEKCIKSAMEMVSDIRDGDGGKIVDKTKDK